MAQCLDLGLRRRADAAYAALPPDRRTPLLDIRLALAKSDFDAVDALLECVAAPASGVPPCNESQLSRIVDLTAPVSPRGSLRVIQNRLPMHPARAALALALGEVDEFERSMQIGAQRLGPDRLLLRANTVAPGDRLTLLNRFFNECGLREVGLLDDHAPLSVTNLRQLELPPSATAATPRLSVVLTAFNAEAYVAAAMRSVLDQEMRELELIAVDDCSSDGTWTAMQVLAASDERVTAVRLARNLGTYAAKNVGLELASGEFVAFQDADDWSHPDRFSRCLALLDQNPRCVAVSCSYIRLTDTGQFHSTKLWPMTRWTPNSMMFRRLDVLNRVGFLDENRFGADSEFVSRVRAQFGSAALLKLQLPLIVAAHRSGSLTTSQETGIDARGQSETRALYEESWTEELVGKLLRGEPLLRQPEATLNDAAAVFERRPSGAGLRSQSRQTR
ncbi:glycosyltransferase family A protein [Variovorax sp. YR752]|uniref:glycosyltransferase family 2 protein n=1 Tax=Variovorax sp. YR752 TaxID=1884383 RepID=UPI003137BBE3